MSQSGLQFKMEGIMKKYLFIFAVLGVMVGGLALNFNIQVYAQEEVRIRITEGMPMIPVALPEFTLRKSSIADEDTKKQVYQVLWNDLNCPRGLGER